MTGSSISAHYYSDKRDMFVFVLALIGIFQFRYQGVSRGEHAVSVVGAVSAVCIGFFPTPPLSPTTEETVVGIVHFTAATLLFGVTAYHCFVMSRRARAKRGARLRAMAYALLGSIILACIIAIAVSNLFHVTDARWRPVFWMEAIALFAFGCAWLLSDLQRRVQFLSGPP